VKSVLLFVGWCLVGFGRGSVFFFWGCFFWWARCCSGQCCFLLLGITPLVASFKNHNSPPFVGVFTFGSVIPTPFMLDTLDSAPDHGPQQPNDLHIGHFICFLRVRVTHFFPGTNRRLPMSNLNCSLVCFFISLWPFPSFSVFVRDGTIPHTVTSFDCPLIPRVSPFFFYCNKTPQ